MATGTTTTPYSGTLDLSVLHKKKFLIDGDETRVLELNTSDLSILRRFSESAPKLEQLGESVQQLATDDDLNAFATQLSEIDNAMRELVDYIFDSNVSELCASDGSMYDPINGQLRYEHIITAIIGLYEENLAKEMAAVNKRMKTHTAKYTGQK